MSLPIECQRDLFDIPDDCTYLNCAYMAPLLKSVINESAQGIKRNARPWNIVGNDFFEPLEVLRRLFAGLINASLDDIALITSTSYGISTAAKCISTTVKPGQKIIMLAEQFPSNVYAWRDIAKSHNLSIVSVARPDTESISWTQAICESIDESTSVVTLPQCHWTDGALLDLSVISERARQVGAKFVLDLTQSL
eukprot:354976_1